MTQWSSQAQERARAIIDSYPEKRSAVMPLLYLAMLEDGHLTDDGMREVATRLPEWSPWFESFQRWGFLVVDRGCVQLARSAARRFDDLWLRGHWWCTPADSLLV